MGEVMALLVMGILVGSFLIFVRVYILYVITKDLNEKDKQKYYDDVEAREASPMGKDMFGGDSFGGI